MREPQTPGEALGKELAEALGKELAEAVIKAVEEAAVAEDKRLAALERVAEVAAKSVKYCPEAGKHRNEPHDCGIWQCFEMRQALAALPEYRPTQEEK